MSSAERPLFITVEEYLTLEDQAFSKSEYIDGWMRAMSGASNRHNDVAGNCFFRLKQMLQGKPCRPYTSDAKVRIRREESTRFYYPDVQVVCELNAPTEVYQDHPVLIIEVLSPSTRRYDLDEKMNAYLQIPTLHCYIALEQHQPVAIVLRRAAVSHYGTANRQSISFLRQVVEGIDAVIELPFLGFALAMRDIYDGIEFTPDCVQESAAQYEATNLEDL